MSLSPIFEELARHWLNFVEGFWPTPPLALMVEVELMVVAVELLLRQEPFAHPDDEKRAACGVVTLLLLTFFGGLNPKDLKRMIKKQESNNLTVLHVEYDRISLRRKDLHFF